MRHYSALVKQFLLSAAAALLLTVGARHSDAQVVFDDLDWTTDRGNIVFTNPGDMNAVAHRPGRNGVTGNPFSPNFPKLDSKRAVRRWVWPTTADIFGSTTPSVPTTTSVSIVVDNPYFDTATGLYLVKGDDTRFYDSTQFYDTTPPVPPALRDASADSLSVWTPANGFVIPAPADRTVFGGFSFSFFPRESTGTPNDLSYPPAAAAGDYGYVYAHHNDFLVDRGTPAKPAIGPATIAELSQLPNVAPNIYAGVQNVLTNATLSQPVAQWSVGATLNPNVGTGAVPAGTYNISLYSPGGGTVIHHNATTALPHPNLVHALVRVSWGANTVVNGVINAGTGAANAGGVNDPVTSRIFLMDLTAPGWLPIGQSGETAVFPYDGNKNDQLVVTIYSVTPDDPNDPALYGAPDPISKIPFTALVIADACRFTQENVDSNTFGPGLGPLPDPAASFIGTSGVIVSPVVGSNKFAPKGVAGATQWYVARQELARDVTPVSYVDPTDPNSLPIPDPTRVASVPVFYCLSNEDQLGNINDQNSFQPSKVRVLWRFVGYPDTGSATVFASPVLANVRGRDGNYHKIVYFCGTNDGAQAGLVGRIYALDAVGDPTTATTTPYWTYPSVRPRSAGEVTAKLPAEYEDPNFHTGGSNSTPQPVSQTTTVYPQNTGPYNTPGHWWAADQTLFSNGSQVYYDGDIVQNSTAPGGYITRTDTRIGENGVGMGGIVGAPIVIEDPAGPAGGAMLLVVPSRDGRLYTFDAGGRGDYIQADNSIVPGTTQRIWTWPHFGADAYHQLFTGTDAGNPVNRFISETNKTSLPYAPAYDPTFPVAAGSGVVHNPIVVSAADGHVYGIQPFHDTKPSILSNGVAVWTERRFWSYPHQAGSLNDTNAARLLDAPGLPTIYRTAGGTASVNFTSGGRIYSLQFPTTYPGSGFSTPSLRWVFPNTPNPPYQDPTDGSTFAYGQGFSAHGLVVVPQSVTSGAAQPLPNDMVYALLTDGSVVAVNYDSGTFYSSGQSLFGSSTISAPIVAEIAPDPNFYAAARTNPPSLAQSVPALIFGDSSGGMYGLKLVAEATQDATNTYGILPLIYARLDTSGELSAPPVLASSNFTGKIGGYYVVGDTNGQLRAYSFGYGTLGDIESVPGTEGSPNGFLGGDVAIDVREFDAYQDKDYQLMLPDTTKAYGSPTTKTSARNVAGVNYGNTVMPIADNLKDGNGNYFALDQGGLLNLVASGVYHAQPVVGVLPNTGDHIALDPPTITVTFRISQAGLQDQVYTVKPALLLTSNTTPNTAGDGAGAGTWPNKPNNSRNYRWPDDRALSAGEHDTLTIYGNDYSDPMNPPNAGTNPPNGSKQLMGRAQNVYPWIAKYQVDLSPVLINGRSTFTPNSTGIKVTVRAVISQPLHSINKGVDTVSTTTDTGFLTMGQRADKGKSNSPYPPDVNNQTPGTYQSPARTLYITNPLALTLRSYTNAPGTNITDQTGLTSYNIIGWYGAIDNPNLAGPTKGLELTGNGAYVGIGGAVAGQPGTGVTKPLFAPFDLTQDNSSSLYQANNNGQRVPAFYVMDRSALYRHGVVQIRARMAPGAWTGTNTSVLNPLPFDTLPINQSGNQSQDYPNLDSRYAQMIVNNSADALRGVANLVRPIEDPTHPGDPAYRTPQPTPVALSIQVPKYFPGNVNHGQVRIPFRGTNIDTGGTFTDQAGYIRGVRKGTGGAGYNDENPIIGPLSTGSGIPNYNNLIGSSPAGGYTGNVEVEVVPPVGTGTGNSTNLGGGLGGGVGGGGGTLIGGTAGGTTFDQAAGLTGLNAANTPTTSNRIFQYGISVAPTFRMKVLETTLDMGNVPHGTGYSDLVANTSGYPGATQYRYPFAPSATGPYTNILSPWDINEQFTALTPPGFNQGRFFRPFTLVSDSNINLVNPRVAKLLGPPNTDNSDPPNMGAVINNSSLSQNPFPGIARAAQLVSDQVNNLLSPPLIAAPFGMATGGSKPNFLGNVGIVSSFDHDSYAQGVLGENNLYPIANPAVDNTVVANATYLSSLYGPALFGPQWNLMQQPRPSVHKPRVNDSSGSVATIPDKPYDFDYQANALNAPVGNQNYLQQQLGLGVFAPPAMAIAVPLGTPVGTYSAPIYPYEDALPIQWQDWLNVSTPANAKPADIRGNNDDILNTTAAGAPSEPYANPAPILKLAVREVRLTEGTTGGTMPQIDIRNGNGNYDPIGFNLQPSAIMVPQSGSGSNVYNKIFLYWATNRQFDPSRRNGKYFLDPVTLTPTPFAPYNIAYSSLNTPYANLNGYYRGDADFGFYKGGNAQNPDGIRLPQWWSVSAPVNSPFALLPGFDAAGLPLDYQNLFNPNNSTDMYNAASVRYGSPATTLGTLFDEATGTFDNTEQEAYLTVQGSVDKSKAATGGPALPQQTETRTFVASLSNHLGNSEIGAPDYSGGTTDTWLKSFVNDPSLPKLSPRPLLIKLRNAPVGGGTKDLKFLYVFWYAGAQGRTSLYYNVNVQANGLGNNFDPLGFQQPLGIGDQKLSTPGALTWQSDPYPAFRRVFDPTYKNNDGTSGRVVDAVDVMFTGQLKNRQTVEILMARYRIVEQAAAATSVTPALAVGQLVPIPFPTVHNETLRSVPGTNTYAARDASWFLPTDQQQTDAAATSNASRFMRIYLQPKGVGKIYPINQQSYVNLGNNVAGGPQRGRIDPASGLVYFNAVATDPANNNIVALTNASRPVFGGGQIVVDARSGTVSFPNIPPGKNDAVYASYTPYIMRINTSRDESNVERDPAYTGNNTPYGSLGMASFPAQPAAVSSGQNYAPTFIIDRAANFRGTLQSPQVLFTVNNQPATSFDNQGRFTSAFLPPVTRMWALYRKTDASGSIKASVYYKSLRLMARLPVPVATVATNGTSTSPLAAQRIQSMTVTGIDRATRGYEVDWVRGRVYFQEEDEGNLVKINYQFYNPKTGASGNSGDLYYRVAWSDEISSTSSSTGDQTTQEVAMPTSSVVNEGQVAAFKDPFIDKLWIFWSSTRAGTTVGNNNPLGQTDLYYETLAPQFYSPVSSQY